MSGDEHEEQHGRKARAKIEITYKKDAVVGQCYAKLSLATNLTLPHTNTRAQGETSHVAPPLVVTALPHPPLSTPRLIIIIINLISIIIFYFILFIWFGASTPIKGRGFIGRFFSFPNSITSKYRMEILLMCHIFGNSSRTYMATLLYLTHVCQSNLCSHKKDMFCIEIRLGMHSKYRYHL